VAGGRIELPTRGFSKSLTKYNLNLINNLQRSHSLKVSYT